MGSPLSLVTGACGFMGTHMVEVLREAGHRIRATDLAQSYEHDDLQRGRFPSILRKHAVEFVPANVCDPSSLLDVVKDVDYIFHIAAIFSYSAPWEVLYRVNVEGTRHLLDALLASASLKKIILWSAGGIYRFPRHATDLPITEKSPIEPENNYLKSKWEQESLLREYSLKGNLRFSALRPTTVYGPRAIYAGGQMIRDALSMKRPMIPNNFTFRIPTVHVRDVCRAALFLAEHPETDGESYNLNDDSQATLIDYLQMIARLTGRKVTLLPPIPISLLRRGLQVLALLEKLRCKLLDRHPPRLEKDLVKYFGIDYVCSNAKLKQTGFKFQYPDFEKGLEATLPWYLDLLRG